MSYDIYMREPGENTNIGDPIKLNKPHHFKGGIYAIGGTNELTLNITYNYGQFYHETIDPEEGIRWLYGKTGEEVLPLLEAAAGVLGVKQSDNYWKTTPGNAGHALLGLIAFCRLRPDGIFEGD